MDLATLSQGCAAHGVLITVGDLAAFPPTHLQRIGEWLGESRPMPRVLLAFRGNGSLTTDPVSPPWSGQVLSEELADAVAGKHEIHAPEGFVDRAGRLLVSEQVAAIEWVEAVHLADLQAFLDRKPPVYPEMPAAVAWVLNPAKPQPPAAVADVPVSSEPAQADTATPAVNPFAAKSADPAPAVGAVPAAEVAPAAEAVPVAEVEAPVADSVAISTPAVAEGAVASPESVQAAESVLVDPDIETIFEEFASRHEAVCKLQTEYEDLKRATRLARRRWEEAQERYNETGSEIVTYHQRGSVNRRLAFPRDAATGEMLPVKSQSQPAQSPSRPSAEVATAGESQSSADPQGKKKDPARIVSVEVLVGKGEGLITEKQAECLLAADIDTIADLEDAIGSGRIAKTKGIGPAGVDRITDAVLAWRKCNPVPEREQKKP